MVHPGSSPSVNKPILRVLDKVSLGRTSECVCVWGGARIMGVCVYVCVSVSVLSLLIYD